MIEKAEPKRRSIVLPGSEWEAFVADVKSLIHAHGRLLDAYGELLNAYEVLPRRYEGPSVKSRIRGFFSRKQTPVAVGLCPYCGMDIEPNARFCRGCGKNLT